MKIKYKIRKFNLTFDIDGDPRRMWVGFWKENNFGYSENESDARIFTRDELENEFESDDILKMEKRIHDKYFLIQECKELDKAFAEIKKFGKKDFNEGKDVYHTIYGLKDKIITTIEKGEIKLSYKDIVVTPSISESIITCLNILIDKIRRLYNYDDPYKHINFKEYHLQKNIK